MGMAAALMTVLCVVCAAWGGGRIYYVATHGSDEAVGTADEPFRTVQRGIDAAGPGDRIVVAPGVYRQRVTLRRAGRADRPIVLEGQAGAILDGSQPWQPRWRPADDIGPDVWRSAIDFEPATLIADGKYLPALRQDKAPLEVFRTGVRTKKHVDTDFQDVGALWMYRSDAGEVLIRFAGGRDPRRMQILAAPLAAVVTISGADYCVVRGFELRNAYYGVYTENTAGSVIEYCTIRCCDHGVWLASKTRNCKVRRCDISLDPIFPVRRGTNWTVWVVFKELGMSDRRGIQLRGAGNGNEIAYNYIHEHHDGIETKSDTRDPAEMQNTDVHHNLIVDCQDDSLEPNGGEVNCRWHHNWTRKDGMGMRIKWPQGGPLYVYRNVFEDSRIWCFQPSDAEVYFYHNTCSHPQGLTWNNPDIPNYHFINNVFLTSRSYAPVEGPAGKMPRIAARQIDYNLYVARDPQVRSAKGYEAHGVAVDSVEAAGVDLVSFHLTPSSPAIDAGADLSVFFGRALPGCEPGYFSGAAADLGAYEYGLENATSIGVNPDETGAAAMPRADRQDHPPGTRP